MKRKNYLLVLILVCTLFCTGCTTTQTKDDPAIKTAIALTSHSYNEASTELELIDDSNSFQISGDAGTELKADLNSDGTEDSVLYTYANIISSAMTVNTLFINGTDFSSVFSDNNIITYNQSKESPYYLVNLDDSDSYIDIAIQDSGVSDDYVTYFFRYDGTQVIYLGSISNSMMQYINMAPIKIIGDGTVRADLSLTTVCLETVGIRVTYILQNGKLDLQEQDWYEIDNASLDKQYQLHDILQDITVNTEPDQNSDTMVLAAGTKNITFDSTDGKEWVMLKTEQGDTYYLHLSSSNTSLDTEQIFSNLFWAD